MSSPVSADNIVLGCWLTGSHTGGNVFLWYDKGPWLKRVRGGGGGGEEGKGEVVSL